MNTFSIDESLVGKRLDVVLSQQEDVNSRNEALKIIKKDQVLVNDSSEKVAPKRIVKIGDTISYTTNLPYETSIKAVPYKLDIRYEDDDLIVVHKPTGMVVHPAPGHYEDTLVNYLLHHTQSLSTNNDSLRPGIVHRIDKETSGILVVAKNNAAHEKLAQQFADHSTHRVYYTLVWGELESEIGKINEPLGRHPVHRKKRAIVKNGKIAVTHWKVLQRFQKLTLVKCKLETGRTHQIRVHMASIGHPIVGDDLYGKYRNYQRIFTTEQVQHLKSFQGQALHAKVLGFVHPTTNEYLEFESELRNDIQIVLDTFPQAL
ncbi:MAG: 23S rRNA pseudouridine1911/1915/1917 synthase [bacterium]|jgi:23S rRNA pseudouridine1911/1915/1917 synthase